MGKPIYEMQIVSVTLEAPDIKTIRLQWPVGYDPEFQSGQFITLFWPENPKYKRAYSLSSCALDRGFYDITVKREGQMGAQIVENAEEGDRLCVMPPAGHFVPVFEPNTHLIFIAGGVGVSPMRGFVREATLRQADTKLTLLYSVRSPEDILFQNEFVGYLEQNRNFRFAVTCTRATNEHDWAGRCGRIDASWVKDHVEDLANTIFYACGSNEMVESVEQLLQQEIGVPRAQIRTEKWGRSAFA